MFYRTLKPIRDRLKYSSDLEKILSRDIFHLIYKPLIDLLSPETRSNAKQSPLIQAFLSRVIHYNEGYVYGKFNASISRALRDAGGTFNNTKKAFKVDLARFTPDVRDAIAQGNMAEQQAIDRVLKKAEELKSQTIIVPAADELSRDTLNDLHKQFEKLTPEDLQIPVEMNEAMEEQVRREYTEAIHLNINNLSQEMTERLRYRVEQAVGQGMRADKLKEVLVAEFGIAKNRAKFIARQDTSLFVAAYRVARYEDAGLELWQWSSSNDSHVRPLHRELNGQIFSFSSPPIIDERTGERGFPGQAFGCRCVMLPCVLQSGTKFTPGMTDGNILETKEHKEIYK
jgi:SPP1 gp7 family putative phage head morphogenesis protein